MRSRNRPKRGGYAWICCCNPSASSTTITPRRSATKPDYSNCLRCLFTATRLDPTIDASSDCVTRTAGRCPAPAPSPAARARAAARASRSVAVAQGTRDRRKGVGPTKPQTQRLKHRQHHVRPLLDPPAEVVARHAQRSRCLGCQRRREAGPPVEQRQFSDRVASPQRRQRHLTSARRDDDDTHSVVRNRVLGPRGSAYC